MMRVSKHDRVHTFQSCVAACALLSILIAIVNLSHSSVYVDRDHTTHITHQARHLSSPHHILLRRAHRLPAVGTFRYHRRRANPPHLLLALLSQNSNSHTYSAAHTLPSAIEYSRLSLGFDAAGEALGLGDFCDAIREQRPQPHRRTLEALLLGRLWRLWRLGVMMATAVAALIACTARPRAGGI